MKDDIDNLTKEEKKLLKRFKNIDYSKLSTSVQKILDELEKQVFFKDIFVIIVEDVFEVMSIKEWNEEAKQKIYDSSFHIWRNTGLFFPSDWVVECAMTVVWAAYCCNYKKYGSVYTLSSEIRGIVNNARCLEISMCANFFNCFGPALGKAKQFELYMFKTYGQDHRDLRNNDNHTLNFYTLMHLLSITGFSYQHPVKMDYTI